MDIIAHKYNNNSIQLLSEHLKNVRTKMSKYANEATLEPEHAEQIAYLHDYGKASKEFQEYIQNDGCGKRVSHSNIGGRILYDAQDLIGSFCVFGHHSGLPDLGTDADIGTTLKGRYYQDEHLTMLAPTPVAKPFVPKLHSGIRNNPLCAFEISLETRMYLSCLVDADWQDSADKVETAVTDEWAAIYHRFFEKTSAIFANAETTPINLWRTEIFNDCQTVGKNGTDKIYSLSAPTGGGKTFASMAFALERVKRGDARRIIYCIPYTSIIEQNADVYESVLGERNVVEHHHLAEYDDKKTGVDETQYRSWTVDNWNAPVVLTTNVQFFESLLSNKTRKVRKLHNIANSVIILDEAQMLPISFLKPCRELLKVLASKYNCTIVLCTATQPGLHIGEEGHEILSDAKGMYERFKRVSAEAIDGTLDISSLAERIEADITAGRNTLCVVNRRQTAQDLYTVLNSRGLRCYHLSLNMCAEHRTKVINQIKADLNNSRKTTDNTPPICVVSTSLIEAGVDLSFDIAYRELTGLDSMVQTAGRVNRHGGQQDAKLLVFQLQNGKYDDFRSIEAGKLLAEDCDVFSIQAIEKYFNGVYSYLNDDNYDEKGIMESTCNYNFAVVGNNARFIDDDQLPIIIPYNAEAESLINKIESEDDDSKVWRRLQKYVVSVYPYVLKELLQREAVRYIGRDVCVLQEPDTFYDMNCGIDIKTV